MLACVFGLISSAYAQSVELVDGRQLRGQITWREGGLRIAISPGQTEDVPWEAVRRLDLRPPTRLVATLAGTLPTEWKAEDIGEVAGAGKSEIGADGTLKLSAYGWGAWGRKDALHWVYRSLAGDGQIVARVVPMPEVEGVTRASCGIILRLTSNPDAPMLCASVSSGGRVRAFSRPLVSQSEVQENILDPIWLRITRLGNRASAYWSRDARQWSTLATAELQPSESILLGVGAWAKVNFAPVTATIDSISFVPGTPDAAFVEDVSIPSRGLILTDGTTLAAEIEAGSPDKGVRLKGQDSAIAWNQMARVIFDRPSQILAGKSVKSGVLMRSGDFLEGDITEFLTADPDKAEKSRLHVKASSMLFGETQISASDVAVVVLKDVAVPSGSWLLRDDKGGAVLARSVQISSNGPVADGKQLRQAAVIERH